MRPLSCAEARQEAARRIFEPLEPHVEATLSAHLAVCDDCRAVVDDQMLGATLLADSLLRHDPPVGLERTIIDSARQPPPAPGRPLRRMITAAVAALLLAS